MANFLMEVTYFIPVLIACTFVMKIFAFHLGATNDEVKSNLLFARHCRSKFQSFSEPKTKEDRMKKDFRQLSLSRSLLAGVLCGIVTAVIIALYAILYRNEAGFDKLLVINPMVICSITPLIVLIAAGIYYLLVHYVGRGEVFFETVFILLVIIGILSDISFHSSTGTLMTTSHGFLFGLELIIGLAICILLPYLAHHPKIFMTKEEMKWE